MPTELPYGPAIILSDPRPKNKCGPTPAPQIRVAHPLRPDAKGGFFAPRSNRSSIVLGGTADQTTSAVNQQLTTSN
jgi:hypothetical protein